jgi:glutamate synthase (NADPH/NADH) large chain/glutamate synthase (ferredoxin)
MLSGVVTRRHPEGLPDSTISIELQGTGGQSFGAFLCQGITLHLIGDANDYTGKGLSGGRVIVRPSADFQGQASQNIIVGNTVMYGATSGSGFFAGVAGERFAVRLSGASAVVEGTGDHGCEYMTGGTVVVLGRTGRNFAAGMSGGIAYVYDEDGQFAKRCNLAMVGLEAVLPEDQQEANSQPHSWHLGQTDEGQLLQLIQDHYRWTGSTRARELLDHWEQALSKFVKVFPHEYRRALTESGAVAKTAALAATVATVPQASAPIEAPTEAPIKTSIETTESAPAQVGQPLAAQKPEKKSAKKSDKSDKKSTQATGESAKSSKKSEDSDASSKKTTRGTVKKGTVTSQ